MMKRCILFLFVAMSVSVLRAMTITTAEGNGADTYVGNDSNKGPDKNYGASSTLDIRINPGVRAHIGYVRFDISGATGDRSSAQLQLYITQGGATRTWNIYGLNDDAVDDAWGEMSITYNTAPGMASASQGNYAIDETKLTLLGTLVVPSLAVNATVTSNTTTLNLDSFLAEDTNGLVTMVLIATGADRQFYVAAKEGLGSNPAWSAPTLILPYAVPESAAMILLGCGGLLTVRRKRR